MIFQANLVGIGLLGFGNLFWFKSVSRPVPSKLRLRTLTRETD